MNTTLEQRLAEVDARLAGGGDASLLVERGGLLAALGRNDAARDAYLAALAREPSHFQALSELGALLQRTDFRAAARTCFAEAVRYHPGEPGGRINLGGAFLAEGLLAEARAEFEAALDLSPDHPDAHQGLANVLLSLGQAEAARPHLAASARGRGVTALPFRGAGEPCRVLLLVSAAGGNVPTRFILDDTLFQVFSLPVEAYSPDMALPAHDLVFNAVGDADLAPQAVDAAQTVLAATAAPVINPPARIRDTGRAAIAERLAGIEGLIAPTVVRISRELVRPAARKLGYPLLARSPGFHTGQFFRRIEGPGDLGPVLDDLPGRELLLIQYLDARDADERWRKYRVMLVGGRLYPLHMAASSDWKVHYFTADMAEHAELRAAEAGFLADMAGVVGEKAMAALEAVAARLGLDYGGVDFGLDPEGRVLLFEANATMVVNPPDADPRWDYRRPAVEAVLTAAKSMLLARAGRG